ncbi:hypothetical protein Tco_0467799 [Tanacetum coccineum]
MIWQNKTSPKLLIGPSVQRMTRVYGRKHTKKWDFTLEAQKGLTHGMPHLSTTAGLRGAIRGVPKITGTSLCLSTVLLTLCSQQTNLRTCQRKTHAQIRYFNQDHFYDDEVPERPRPTIPTTSSPPKVVEHETKVTKDTVLPTNNGSTKDVQPPVVQVQSQVPNSEPIVDPVSAPTPNPNPSIPYPSRRNDEKRCEKSNDQVEKFYKIFQDMSFEISLADALILMPKFASTLKALIGNKEKLKGELTLRVGKEAITFNLDQTSRYSSNYDEMTANRIEVIEMACEEYSKEFLGFSDVDASAIPLVFMTRSFLLLRLEPPFGG